MYINGEHSKVKVSYNIWTLRSYYNNLRIHLSIHCFKVANNLTSVFSPFYMVSSIYQISVSFCKINVSRRKPVLFTISFLGVSLLSTMACKYNDYIWHRKVIHVAKTRAQTSASFPRILGGFRPKCNFLLTRLKVTEV